MNVVAKFQTGRIVVMRQWELYAVCPPHYVNLCARVLQYCLRLFILRNQKLNKSTISWLILTS